MELGRKTWGAAIRLAITLSVLAAAAAAFLHSIGILSQPVIVLAVIVVGFVTSWVRTGQVERSDLEQRRARGVVRVPVRGVHFPVS